jgi:hypothetical protein
MTTVSLSAAAHDSAEREALCSGGARLTFAMLSAMAEHESHALIPELDNGLPVSELGLEACVAFTPQADFASIALLLALADRGIPVALLHRDWTAGEVERALTELRPRGVVHLAGPIGASFVPYDHGRASAAHSHSSAGNEAVDSIVVTRCLLARRTVIVPESRSGRLTTDELAGVIQAQQPTLLSLVPTQLGRLLALNGFDLPTSVRAILVGGARTPTALVATAQERGWPILTSYGLTEACSQVATVRPGSPPGSAFSVLSGIDVKLRNERIWVSGPNLFSGYVEGGSLSVPMADDGWFETSDLGELTREGALTIFGRADDVIVSGGEKVRPCEVEQVLLTYPGCEAVCVVGVPDSIWGQAVVAVVQGPSLDLAGLETFAGARLARFKRPKHVLLVQSLPSAGIDKENRREIRGWAAAQLNLATSESKLEGDDVSELQS